MKTASIVLADAKYAAGSLSMLTWFKTWSGLEEVIFGSIHFGFINR
jgi:hypothetical protein